MLGMLFGAGSSKFLTNTFINVNKITYQKKFVLSSTEVYNLNNHWTQMNADYQDFTSVNFLHIICENPPTVYIMLRKFNVFGRSQLLLATASLAHR